MLVLGARISAHTRHAVLVLSYLLIKAIIIKTGLREWIEWN